MRTIKEIFNANLDENITFEYFSPDGYRVFSDKNTPNPYFHYKTKIINKEELDIGCIKTTKIQKVKVKLYIEDSNTMEKVKCPECEQDDYLKIQKLDGKNTTYVCKNKTCSTHFFKHLLQIEMKTLDILIKSHFKISSIKGHRKAYSKYKSMHKEHKRINIEDEDIQYLEHYLLLGISRDLIAKLFSITTRTLRRFIKKEESLEKNGKGKFKKDEQIYSEKILTIYKTLPHDTHLFKSKIRHAYIDRSDEKYKAYEEPKYYIEKKINHSSKK